MIALGRALAARGNTVTLQTWTRWRSEVEAEGLGFAPAPEYEVFPSGPEPLDFYEAVVHAANDTLPQFASFNPDVAVADILTLAPALAAEMEGVPVRDADPARLPAWTEPTSRSTRSARGCRARRSGARSGAARSARSTRPRARPRRAQPHARASSAFRHSTMSTAASAASSRSSRRSRSSSIRAGWPAHVHVVGPLMWEPPAEDVELPPGEQPLVLVAPSTAQDREHRLLRAALRGLADAPVRVLATWNRRLPPRPLPVPENTRIVDWVSYSRTMPLADVVVCHAGHGTLVRALASGCAVVACPAVGDMNENAARLDWAGAGVRVPRRFISPRSLELALERVLDDQRIGARAREIADWGEHHDAGDLAARLVEQMVA